MPKTIVFCADGTWNGPVKGDQQDDGCTPRLTNVCKLFGWLEGASNTTWGSPDMEKLQIDREGNTVQVAKYIHGVGDSSALLEKITGGAFGIGVVARIARGYTYISRNHQPGDRIVIVGFSRGAYTARALAGLVVSQGLLKPALATDPADKYDNAVQAWYRYRRGRDASIGQRLLDRITGLHNIWDVFKSPALGDADFVPVAGLAAVAVWDTVGALGIPLYGMDGQARDVFGFCDTSLSSKVNLGLHAVSLDEQRKAFQPTLWDDAPNVTQALFPGGHGDVGGGYEQHGLSDLPLLWFVDRLQHPDVGLKFAADPPTPVKPDPCGCAHAQWKQSPWPALGAVPRALRAGLMVHDAVRQRMRADAVQAEPPPAKPAKYLPPNLPANLPTTA